MPPCPGQASAHTLRPFLPQNPQQESPLPGTSRVEGGDRCTPAYPAQGRPTHPLKRNFLLRETARGPGPVKASKTPSLPSWTVPGPVAAQRGAFPPQEPHDPRPLLGHHMAWTSPQGSHGVREPAQWCLVDAGLRTWGPREPREGHSGSMLGPCGVQEQLWAGGSAGRNLISSFWLQ